jgi:SUKH-4 immunity protein
MCESFSERWTRKERECGLESLRSELISCAGSMLPKSAAPCLSFREAAQPRPIWEVFGTAADWSAADRARLAPYLIIGFDGAGNPLCLKKDSGEVWLLDHERGFNGLEFVNHSVSQLAECVLAYLGELDPQRFRQSVQGIDSGALDPTAFWWYAAQELEDERDESNWLAE